MAQWQDGYVKSNGIRLHYTRTGGDKWPIVMAHGLTDNSRCWSRVARALEHYNDLIMVDARGHGKSDKPETGYAPEDHAADLAGLIQELKLERPIVMGHSMGGVSAGLLAAQHPELVSAAILEDPAWHWPTTVPQDYDDARATYESWKARNESRGVMSAAELRAQGRFDNPRWALEEFDDWVVAKEQAAPQVIEFILHNRPDWPELAAKFEAPVLLVYGDPALGGIIGPDLAAEARRVNPLIQPTQIPGAGHNVRREGFGDFMSAVREFLAAVRRAAPEPTA
jgi:pimeloyl-ACP methyl ester carboxylesterase